MKTSFFALSFTTLSASAHLVGRDVGNSSDTYVHFCAGSTSKHATAEQIAYKGKTGTEEDYGCHIMTVGQTIASQYEYTATFNNVVSEDQACVCFKRIGPDGQIHGSWSGNEAISFTLPAGGSKIVAFDANSQGGCVCGVGKVPTANGQFAGTWLEFDFGNKSNDNWSGADASCLVAATHGLETPALKVCSSGICSTINTDGTGENEYIKGTEVLNGVGLNIPPGKVYLTVTVGE